MITRSLQLQYYKSENNEFWSNEKFYETDDYYPHSNYWAYIITKVRFKESSKKIKVIRFYRSFIEDEFVGNLTRPNSIDTVFRRCLGVDSFIDNNYFPPNKNKDGPGVDRFFTMTSDNSCSYSKGVKIQIPKEFDSDKEFDFYELMARGPRKMLKMLRFSFIQSKEIYSILTREFTRFFDHTKFDTRGLNIDEFKGYRFKFPKPIFTDTKTVNSMARVITKVIIFSPNKDQEIGIQFYSKIIQDGSKYQEIGYLIIAKNEIIGSVLKTTVSLRKYSKKEDVVKSNLFEVDGKKKIKITIKSTMVLSTISHETEILTKSTRCLLSVDISISTIREFNDNEIAIENQVFFSHFYTKPLDITDLSQLSFLTAINDFINNDSDSNTYLQSVIFDDGGFDNRYFEKLAEDENFNLNLEFYQKNGNNQKDTFTKRELTCSERDKFIESIVPFECKLCLKNSCKYCINKKDCLEYKNGFKEHKNSAPTFGKYLSKSNICYHESGYNKTENSQYGCDACPKNCKRCYQDNQFCNECSQSTNKIELIDGECKCKIDNCEICSNWICDRCKPNYLLHINPLFESNGTYEILDMSKSQFRCLLQTTCYTNYILHRGTKDTTEAKEKTEIGDFCFKGKCFIGYSNNSGECVRCNRQSSGFCQPNPNEVEIKKNQQKYILVNSNPDPNRDFQTQITNVEPDEIYLKNCNKMNAFNNCLRCEPDFILSQYSPMRIGCDCPTGYSRETTADNNLKCKKCIERCKILMV